MDTQPLGLPPDLSAIYTALKTANPGKTPNRSKIVLLFEETSKTFTTEKLNFCKKLALKLGWKKNEISKASKTFQTEIIDTLPKIKNLSDENLEAFAKCLGYYQDISHYLQPQPSIRELFNESLKKINDIPSKSTTQTTFKENLKERYLTELTTYTHFLRILQSDQETRSTLLQELLTRFKDIANLPSFFTQIENCIPNFFDTEQTIDQINAEKTRLKTTLKERLDSLNNPLIPLPMVDLKNLRDRCKGKENLTAIITTINGMKTLAQHLFAAHLELYLDARDALESSSVYQQESHPVSIPSPEHPEASLSRQQESYPAPAQSAEPIQASLAKQKTTGTALDQPKERYFPSQLETLPASAHTPKTTQTPSLDVATTHKLQLFAQTLPPIEKKQLRYAFETLDTISKQIGVTLTFSYTPIPKDALISSQTPLPSVSSGADLVGAVSQLSAMLKTKPLELFDSNKPMPTVFSLLVDKIGIISIICAHGQGKLTKSHEKEPTQIAEKDTSKEPFTKLETVLYKVPAPEDASILSNPMAKAIEEGISRHNLVPPQIESVYSFAEDSKTKDKQNPEIPPFTKEPEPPLFESDEKQEIEEETPKETEPPLFELDEEQDVGEEIQPDTTASKEEEFSIKHLKLLGRLWGWMRSSRESSSQKAFWLHKVYEKKQGPKRYAFLEDAVAILSREEQDDRDLALFIPPSTVTSEQKGLYETISTLQQQLKEPSELEGTPEEICTHVQNIRDTIAEKIGVLTQIIDRPIPKKVLRTAIKSKSTLLIETIKQQGWDGCQQLATYIEDQTKQYVPLSELEIFVTKITKLIDPKQIMPEIITKPFQSIIRELLNNIYKNRPVLETLCLLFESIHEGNEIPEAIQRLKEQFDEIPSNIIDKNLQERFDTALEKKPYVLSVPTTTFFTQLKDSGIEQSTISSLESLLLNLNKTHNFRQKLLSDGPQIIKNLQERSKLYSKRDELEIESNQCPIRAIQNLPLSTLSQKGLELYEEFLKNILEINAFKSSQYLGCIGLVKLTFLGIKNLLSSGQVNDEMVKNMLSISSSALSFLEQYPQNEKDKDTTYTKDRNPHESRRLASDSGMNTWEKILDCWARQRKTYDDLRSSEREAMKEEEEAQRIIEQTRRIETEKTKRFESEIKAVPDSLHQIFRKLSLEDSNVCISIVVPIAEIFRKASASEASDALKDYAAFVAYKIKTASIQDLESICNNLISGLKEIETDAFSIREQAKIVLPRDQQVNIDENGTLRYRMVLHFFFVDENLLPKDFLAMFNQEPTNAEEFISLRKIAQKIISTTKLVSDTLHSFGFFDSIRQELAKKGPTLSTLQEIERIMTALSKSEDETVAESAKQCCTELRELPYITSSEDIDLSSIVPQAPLNPDTSLQETILTSLEKILPYSQGQLLTIIEDLKTMLKEEGLLRPNLQKIEQLMTFLSKSQEDEIVEITTSCLDKIRKIDGISSSADTDFSDLITFLGINLET